MEGYELQSRQTLDVRVDLLGLAASHSNLSLDSSYGAVARTFDSFPCARGAVNLTCPAVTPMIHPHHRTQTANVSSFLPRTH